jgi:hypothetical protein
MTKVVYDKKSCIINSLPTHLAVFPDSPPKRPLTWITWVPQVAISSAAQAWGIIVAITMCITAGVSFCYGMSSLSFLRGWYEVGAASGGNKVAIPSAILGFEPCCLEKVAVSLKYCHGH